MACDLLAGAKPPDLLLLRLAGTAPALASFGPGSPQAARAFRALDRRIGGLVDCLADVDRLSSSVIGVVGDHGIASAHTAIAANVVLAEAGLIASDEAGISSWGAIARANGGTAFVYARDESAAVRARLALVGAAEQTRAFRVVSAEEMIRHGADPEAWFGLEADPGFVFGEAVDGEILRVSDRQGVGGYLPDRPEMDAALVLWGGPVRAGLRIPRMGQVDVAPTLARILGVELDPGEGRALVGVLAPGSPARVAAPGSDP
jgi:predicted AlkP superfamily pyrophosphatase or phosphodiesterase